MGKCYECPLGYWSKQVGASTNPCVRCTEGKFADRYGTTECTPCTTFGTYCEVGAVKVEECDQEKFYCTGLKKIDRPTAPSSGSLRVSKLGLNEVLVQGLNTSTSTYIVELSISKQVDNLAEAENATGALIAFTTELEDEKVVVGPLNLGAKYYARVREIGVRAGDKVVGIASTWTDVIDFQCPEGAYCGNETVGGVPLGIPMDAVKPLDVSLHGEQRQRQRQQREIVARTFRPTLL